MQLESYCIEQFDCTIRAFKWNNNTYVVANDVIDMLGYSKRTADVIKNFLQPVDYIHISKSGVKVTLSFTERIFDLDSLPFDYTEIGRQGGYCITLFGLSTILQKTERLSHDKKQVIYKILKDLELLKEMAITSRKEIDFVDMLEQTLQPFSIKGESQYYVGNYRIDYYIPSLKVAIEYDEGDHKGYTYEQQELRQEVIENELGCKFVRVSDSNSHSYNVGLVIKELIRMELL